MLDPYNQIPHLIYLIGIRSKDQALKYLFLNNNFGHYYEKGNINLRADNASINTVLLLFIIDSNLFCRFTAKHPQAMCYLSQSHTILWMKDNDMIMDVLFSRLIFPFSDLICVFADDFTTLEIVIRWILLWIAIWGCV